MTDEQKTMTAGTPDTYYTKERILGELHFRLAENIGKAMLNSGLINGSEYARLSTINRETFPPLFAEIYPQSPCYVSKSE